MNYIATNKITELRRIAKKRNGKCLSKKYLGQKTSLAWQCERGHRWLASPNSIVHLHTWCPVCAGNQILTIEEVKKLAIRKGGKCLAKHYRNSKEKLLWECNNGHQWFASTFSIKIRNSWCPECYLINKQLKIKSHENKIF